MNYIDTHFHLDLWKNPENLLAKLEDKEIYTIAVTNSPSVFHYTYKIAKDKKFIRPALGFHPELVAKRRSEIDMFLELLRQTKYVGEIGLDYSSDGPSERKVQKEVFNKIIRECSKSRGKVVTVHSRRAHHDVIEIIGDRFPGTVILHWYSGSLTELQRAIDYGFYFSVNHAMTISERGRKIISRIPLDRLLTESDGPFVTCNNVKCSPLHIEAIIRRLSNILLVKEESLKKQIFNNFKESLNRIS